MARDLNDIQVFVAVVEASSFTLSAKALGVPTSTVSRRVARLEKQLGARLLQRTTRKLSLTEAGQLYFERSVRVLTELDEAESILSQAQATPRGRVRISAPLEYSISMRLANEFLAVYPEVRVEVEFTSRSVNILEEGYDAAIVAGRLTNMSVVAHKLMDSAFSIVASPAYIQRRGEPKTISDLSEHDCVIFGASSVNAHWILGAKAEPIKVPVRGRVAANNLLAVRDAALAGHGIALLPNLVCGAGLQRGDLRSVLADHSPPGVPLHITYPAGRHLPAGVRMFVEHVKANFRRIAEAVPEARAATGGTPRRPSRKKKRT